MSLHPQSQSREDRLNNILLDYVEACEAGGQPDQEEILARHPELAEDLALFFCERDRLERLGGVIRNVEQNADDRFRGATTDASRVAPPETVNGCLGDFRLLREVGRGGMGIVYEAEQISLGRRVALKILPFASALDPRQLQRFKNEAIAAAHLMHENIVSVYSVGCERGVHYFAMRFVEGQSLSALITQMRQPQEGQPAGSTGPVAKLSTEKHSSRSSHFDWIARLGIQAARALEHAHQTGVIHRDVKPGNLLLDTRGQLWITDFGLAHIADDGGLTMTGEMLGTLRYASPEQTLGRRGVADHRSDVYSLGATLYELLTLRPPFNGSDRHELLRQIVDEEPPSLRSVVPDIPENLETVVLKALRKDPGDRYATAQELAEDLQRFLDRRPILARPPGLAEHFRIWTRRHPTSLMAGAITLFFLTAASIVIAILVGAEQERTRAEQRRTRAAYRAERLRAEEAESRLRLARRAVDELLHISEEELADRPEMAILRKRVLRSAVGFYQEFLVDRHDHPDERAELLETTSRVEKILADLEVLRSATHFYLLCQPAVLKDLNITPSQLPEIEELTAHVGREWMDSFKDLGLISPTERSRRIFSQARVNDSKLNSLLTPSQQWRLKQIGLQSEGAAAFRDQEVALAIGLSPRQREQIRVIEDDTKFGWMRARNPSVYAGGRFAGGESALSPNERILQVLTKEQAWKWREMTGDPLEESLFPLSVPTQTRSER